MVGYLFISLCFYGVFTSVSFLFCMCNVCKCTFLDTSYVYHLAQQLIPVRALLSWSACVLYQLVCAFQCQSLIFEPSGYTRVLSNRVIDFAIDSGQRQRWKTPGELGVNRSAKCDIFPFVALTLLVG